MTKKPFKERLKYIFIKFLLSSAFVFSAVLWVCSWSYSEGTRSGNLTKVSKKGVIFKSFEGQLNLGGISMASRLEGNIWSFTMLEESLMNTIKSYEGKKVKVFYKERYKTMPWLVDTNYIVNKIEKVNP